jgi:hypothetical protein
MDPTTRKLRDALVALDGRAAGASFYEVAIVLYGASYSTASLPPRPGINRRGCTLHAKP